MADLPLPPTDHVLRPHHVDLLTLLVLTFKEFESRPLPPTFSLHLYRLLLNEISEVQAPKTRQQLLAELAAGPKSDDAEPKNLITAFKTVHTNLATAEQINNFFGSLPALFVDKTEDDIQPILMRRSLFGYFCRRCFLSFLKLSFTGVVKIQHDYQAWCKGDRNAGYGFVEKDQLDHSSQFIFRTTGDHKMYAQPAMYDAFEMAKMTGDQNGAVESLRRFFEQHFHDNNDSGIRQHALLNLVRMHYIQGEIPAARKLLSEAINTSRICGDNQTLQHCISMLHRMPPPEGKKPPLNEIQPNLSPLEVLFDVKKLLDTNNDQPIATAWIKIFQAIALYDYWVDARIATPVGAHQWAQHAVQSIVWSASGCDELSTIEANIVIALSVSGSSDHNRIITILNQAYKTARQGEYAQGLAMLLDPDVWRGIELSDFGLWAHEVWHILALRAVRRGQLRLYSDFLPPRRPVGEYHPRMYQLALGLDRDHNDKVASELQKVLSMKNCDQAAAAIEQLLKALWQSEFLFRMNYYRTAIICLADVGLEFGMSKRCRRILEEIMPQIVLGGDIEQRAVACFTLARCIMVADSSPVGLREALHHLLMSEADFLKLEMSRQAEDVQYLISVVYHNLGMEEERDGAALRHADTEAYRKSIQDIIVDPEVVEILGLVASIGGNLSSRE